VSVLEGGAAGTVGAAPGASQAASPSASRGVSE